MDILVIIPRVLGILGKVRTFMERPVSFKMSKKIAVVKTVCNVKIDPYPIISLV
jgi:hypothetical protein